MSEIRPKVAMGSSQRLARSYRPLIKITEAAQSGFPFSVPSVRMLRNWHFTFATGASTDRNLSELRRAQSSISLSTPKRENDDSFQLIRTSLSRLPLRGWIE